MLKATATSELVIAVTAVANVEFGPTFREKLQQGLNEFAANWKIGGDLLTVALPTATQLIIKLNLDHAFVKDTVEIRAHLMSMIEVAIDQGPNSDVLNAYLDKYPDLRNHPDLDKLIANFSAFDRQGQAMVNGETFAGNPVAATQVIPVINPKTKVRRTIVQPQRQTAMPSVRRDGNILNTGNSPSWGG